MAMTEKDIQKELSSRYDHLYMLTNSFVFGWESDYFGITKGTGYIYEIEIKVSRSDFRADFKNKTHKHRCLSNASKELIVMPTKEETKWDFTGEVEERKDRLGNNRIERIRDNVPQGYCKLIIKKNFVPNRFYYAVPAELVDNVKDLVPEYAGLISIDKFNVIEVKSAPLLHKRKLLSSIAPILLDKFYYGLLNKERECEMLKRDLKIDKYYYEPDHFEENVENMQLTIFE